MENIKKQFSKAYILLESLVTLSLLMIISSVILGQVRQSHQKLVEIDKQIEELNTVKMALDVGRDSLSANDVSVKIVQDDRKIVILNEKGEERFAFKILEIQK